MKPIMNPAVDFTNSSIPLTIHSEHMIESAILTPLSGGGKTMFPFAILTKLMIARATNTSPIRIRTIPYALERRMGNPADRIS